jgi:alkylation response protein AidB-like acyl-CoA dehydrogenase
MTSYTAPLDDYRFLLMEVFDLDQELRSLPGLDAVDSDLILTVLEQAGRFAAERLAPLNASGDGEGARLIDGIVTTPKGFREAYAAFAAGGWCAVSGDPKFGGQGLPRLAQTLLDEIVSAANLSFSLFPGLTRGSVEAILSHASESLQATYLPKLISGEWTGAMALTEASAGTDLGLLTTRATPQPDGSYIVTGTKIFISSGDHDFGGNVVHLVLARLPDAPKGVKGISLFLVPKFLPGAEGELGVRNALSVGALEHKMGIHAQPTCVMNYEGATGWLVGEPHRGLNAMFTMMNTERVFVGVQGLGVAEAAYQAASAYAKQRLQGRSADGMRGPVAIIEHTAVRKTLLTIRAFIEAARAFAVWTTIVMEQGDRHTDPVKRASARGLVALVTPVIKAAFTDFGFDSAVMAQQVFGGHGYVRESGMEQLVRDARIAQIYEGTNGVQAMDLVGRKLSMEDGRLPGRFFDLIEADLRVPDTLAGAAALVAPVREALNRLRGVTSWLSSKRSDTAEVGAAASDYLRLFALLVFGWMWIRMAVPGLKSAGEATAQQRDKRILAQFFIQRMLPEVKALEVAIQSGAASLLAWNPDRF